MYGLILTELGQYVAAAYGGYCIKKGYYKQAAIASIAIVGLEVTQYYLAAKGLNKLVQNNKYYPPRRKDK